MPKARPVLPQHVEFLDEHFGVSPQWKSFHKNLKNEKFVDAVRQDTRSDRKLKRFSKMVGLRERAKQKGVLARGDTGRNYRINYHPEVKRFSCSCKDWTFKRSVKNKGPGGNCKHIKRMKSEVQMQLTKTGMSALSVLARVGRGLHQEDKMSDQIMVEYAKHKAYKKYFKRPSLIEQAFLKGASVRGNAAAAFLEGAKKLSLHPRM